ncbi:hypothetical protein [Marinilabilia salmonicolor]|uniref:hypothetical protein n=1 Tax=Marinilabilia salmonicolor TaxID=989 RepID=UPI00029ACDF0|nr:hypothetical protein [Marinilabilia salmonicolor]
MRTYRTYLLSAFAGLLFGLTFFMVLLWISYGWEEATDSIYNVLIVIAVVGFVFPLFHLRRLKYPDSAALTPPEFKDVRHRVFGVDTDRFDYGYFLKLIEEQNVMTREGEHSLKLRTKFSFRNALACAFLKFDEIHGKMDVYYYSVPGYTRRGTKAVTKLDQAFEEMIRRSLKA